MNFLEHVLKRMGLNKGWVNMIMHCVSSVTYAVLVNGQPTKWFTHQHGLRQGDSTSQYLFCLFLSFYLPLPELSPMLLNGKCFMVMKYAIEPW